jgi:hypothetical protein
MDEARATENRSAHNSCTGPLARVEVQSVGKRVAQYLVSTRSPETAPDRLYSDFINRLISGIIKVDPPLFAEIRRQSPAQITACFPSLRALEPPPAPPNCSGPLSRPEVQVEARQQVQGLHQEALGAQLEAGTILYYFKGRMSIGASQEVGAALASMDRQQISACFPELDDLLKAAQVRETARDEARQKQRRDEELRRRQEEEMAEADLRALLTKQVPVSQLRVELGQSYSSYLIIKKCYDARLGYSMIYISDGELARAREQIKQLENKIKVPAINIRDLWERANTAADEHGRGGPFRSRQLPNGSIST